MKDYIATCIPKKVGGEDDIYVYPSSHGGEVREQIVVGGLNASFITIFLLQLEIDCLSCVAHIPSVLIFLA